MEIIICPKYSSSGNSSEFTSTFRQGREDGQNIVNDNLVADFVAYGGNRTEVSYVTFNTTSEVAKLIKGAVNLKLYPIFFIIQI